MENNQIIIYQTPDGTTAIDVVIDQDTVWLSQKQMIELFQSSRQNISLHINNIFNEGELEKNATVKESLTVQYEGKRTVKRKLEQYSLDVIISVGYRVKSIRGTQFRIWANKILKEFLTQGYALNEKRLQEQNQQFEALKQTIRLMGKVTGASEVSSDEANGLLKVITDYTYALDVLDKYDHRSLTIEAIHTQQAFTATYADAMGAIRGLRDKFGGSRLFGNEKDESFRSSMAAIYQTFDGKELYPSVEEKAAQLLYFVVKNHSFSDGNKRIAAFLFVWFLEKNNMLYREDGGKRIADNALVAITLMIAESNPVEMDIMAQVVVNLINGYN
ncbi:virulence protein RhuM/Fic/DOC family protein [Chitinophaga nivalis]|uniref:Virulence protein RhuM/Fic/DOC family protein n=1 Tax=Chitinophaga nivalis TaxID=2991709 RepID=A0ABT3IET4_9BACT|nr:virulence protein RhuM/Fic/DOC family protein [Chitinophaga nivalis]MCW3467843.1 virulence protein RhuM/Fic/DOC family protein [Chitinophaga nivalis]MCW3482465.1 virulence protein RhuM/Fic/DOC family protein [Chitinophaga nivalis]